MLLLRVLIPHLTQLVRLCLELLFLFYTRPYRSPVFSQGISFHLVSLLVLHTLRLVRLELG